MNENVERKIDVKEFCRRFDMAKNDEAKQKMLESIITRKYCPVLEKKVILQTMFDKIIVTGPNGVSHMDYFLSKVNMVTTTLILYTNIKVSKTDDSETTAFDDYDMLRQRNIMNMIWETIGQDELDELLSINGLIMNNYMEENKTADAYVKKYVDAAATTLGLFVSEGLQELVSQVKGEESEKNAKDIAEDNNDIKTETSFKEI